MDVRLQGHFTLRSPLSHIGESVSTQSFLAEEPILQPDGTLEPVFVYSGNAWRGQLRDLAAAYMLEQLGDPQLPLEAFHLLFAGGRIGGEQTVNVERARAWRRAIPLVALWGGGVGNQILPGKLRVANSYPLCREAIPCLLHSDPSDAGRVSYRALTTERSYSRKDDSKDDRLAGWLAPQAAPALQSGMFDDRSFTTPAGAAKKKKEEPAEQMRMTVELLAAGTRLETRVEVLAASEVELGCLVSALHRFGRSPHIGGQAQRGLGLVDLTYDLVDLATGERRPFLTAGPAGPALGAEAERAKAAYDQHLLTLYDAMLGEQGGEIVRMLGAQVA